jgi:hypothetical protein
LLFFVAVGFSFVLDGFRYGGSKRPLHQDRSDIRDPVKLKRSYVIEWKKSC